MTTTVLRMPADQHRRYHYSAGRMMRSGVHPRGVLGHQERVRPAVQDGQEHKRKYEGELAPSDEVKDGC